MALSHVPSSVDEDIETRTTKGNPVIFAIHDLEPSRSLTQPPRWQGILSPGLPDFVPPATSRGLLWSLQLSRTEELVAIAEPHYWHGTIA
jgi:hypothetical protein